MRMRSSPFVAVAWQTARESLRQPIVLLPTAAAVLIMAVLPLVVAYQFGEQGRLERDSALALHFVVGLIVAVSAASSSLSREIRSGTAALVLSKSVGRGMFFLAKYAGVAAVILVFSLAAAMGTLLGPRIGPQHYVVDARVGVAFLAVPFVAFACGGLLNFRRRQPFPSAALAAIIVLCGAVLAWAAWTDRAGRLAPFGASMDWRVLPASALVTLSLLVVGAISLALATRVGTVPNLAVCAVVFMVGLVSDYLLSGPASSGSAVARALYAVIPNWQHFWQADALAGSGTIPWGYVGWCALYGAACVGGALSLGLAVFRHAEVER